MSTKIKICGLRREEDIWLVNDCKPDYIGFVFAKSKRQVSGETATKLKQLLNPNIHAVGVFVNASIEEIAELCEKHIIDVVQLHGDENQDYILELKKYVKNPIIKAVRVQSTEQILEAEKLPCDMLLLDTYTKGQYGGSGVTFDYELIPKLEKPYFLAGGLTVENVAQAVKYCNPYAVDISSGVETDGWKDAEKVRALIKNVRKNF